MTEIALALPSILKERMAEHINTGPTGRFQQELYLDPHVKGPCTVEASFLTDSKNELILFVNYLANSLL